MSGVAILHLLLACSLLASEATASFNGTPSTGSSSGYSQMPNNWYSTTGSSIPLTNMNNPGTGFHSTPNAGSSSGSKTGFNTGSSSRTSPGSSSGFNTTRNSGSRNTNSTITFEACVPVSEYGDFSCEAEYGNITSPKFVGSVIYKFPRDSPVSVMVWVDRNQLINIEDSSDSKCYFGINGRTFDDVSNFRDVSTFYMTSDDVITMYIENSPDCYISMLYAAVIPVYTTITFPADQTTGTIVFPLEEELDGLWSYPPQQRRAYIFNYPENYAINFKISQLDLGYRSSDLHWTITTNNLTYNDFLLVGQGTEILETTDLALYGHRDAEVDIRVYSRAAHLVLYTNYHEQNASGLTIQYEAHRDTSVVVTTAEPTTTPFSPSLPTPDSTWAPIDGVLNTYSSKAELEDAFCVAVASMASTYINSTGMEVDPPQSISPSDVLVYTTATCKASTCQDSCAAFNFSIRKLVPSQEAWAFSQKDLDTMLRANELQYEWTDKMCADCTFCEENISHSWWVLGGVAAGVVVVTLLLAVLVWSVSSRLSLRRSKEDTEEGQKLEALERRRRSSGDVSVIGGVKGGSKASLPFGGGMEDEDQETHDTQGFTEYDADNTMEDFSIGAEILNDPRAMKFYSNEGFEADEADFAGSGFPSEWAASRGNPGFVEPLPYSRLPHVGFAPLGSVPSPTPALKSNMKGSRKRRSPRDASGGYLPAVEEAGSGDVSALQFRPSNRRLQFTVPAEVHQESFMETVLSDGAEAGSHDCGDGGE